MIARDHNGQVLDAASCFLSFVANVLVAELTTIKEGVILAKHKGWTRFSIFLDGFSVVMALKKFPKCCSDFDALLCCIFKLLQTHVSKVFYLNPEVVMGYLVV